MAGSIVVAQHIGVAVMRGLAVHGTDFVYKSYCLSFSFRVTDITDKFAFFLNKTGFRTAVYSFIAHYFSSSAC